MYGPCWLVHSSYRIVPRSIAFSLDMAMAELTMVYGRYNELVNGVYTPTYDWGAPSSI